MNREGLGTRKLITGMTALLLAAAIISLLSGCRVNGAEAQVREDLESMRYVELDPGVEAEMNSLLTDSGREYFEMFLAKAGEFEYEIAGSRDEEVTVRITTYDFASEYLRSWSDFLEAADAGQAGYDDAELYERLFANLSKVKDKDYRTEVVISCTQNEDGSWETDAKSSIALRNAILGGMLDEIAGLAGVSDQ